MKPHHLTSTRHLSVLLCLALILGAAGPIDFNTSADAASQAAVKRLKKKLKKTKKRLRIALARASNPGPVAMVDIPAGDPAENPADAGNTSDPDVFGSVPYDFRIGKYEVSLDEYTAFLNAVAKTDAGEPNGLYHSSMGSDQNIAGITRSGGNGSYVYTVVGSGKRPMTYVSWFDAARYCNWLHNGRPTGMQDTSTTERGAYILDGAIGGNGFERQWGAKYWIPSEHEWYKAAYHHPQSEGGPSDHYHLYPTSSDTPPGNDIGPLPNQANFQTPDGNFSVTETPLLDIMQNYLTNRGSYPGSPTFYGTFDQGGNVQNWIDVAAGASSRIVRGGHWMGIGDYMRSSDRFAVPPTQESDIIGFRVASFCH